MKILQLLENENSSGNGKLSKVPYISNPDDTIYLGTKELENSDLSIDPLFLLYKNDGKLYSFVDGEGGHQYDLSPLGAIKNIETAAYDFSGTKGARVYAHSTRDFQYLAEEGMDMDNLETDYQGDGRPVTVDSSYEREHDVAVDNLLHEIAYELKYKVTFENGSVEYNRVYDYVKHGTRWQWEKSQLLIKDGNGRVLVNSNIPYYDI